MSHSPDTARRATIDDEASLLERWASGFSTVLGEAATVEPCEVEGVPGHRIRVPPTSFEMPTLVGGTGHFRHMPGMVEHVRRLGFDWADDGRIWAFPSPATFNALLPLLAERYAGPGAGFSFDWVEHDGDVLPMGRWLQRTMDGRLSAHLCSPERYGSAAVSQGRANVRFSLQSLAHDVTVHGLNSHLVPREAIDTLAARIRDALPDRYAAWSAADAMPPLHLAFFYDNDFNRYCYAVWCRTRHPGEFAERFLRPAHFEQLLGVLDTRIDEVRRGLSDVASGDTKDIAPPKGVEYRID